MKKELSFYQKAILICFSILIFFSSGEICVRMIRYGEKYAKKDNFFDYPVTYNFFRKRTLPNGEKILSGYREGVEHKEFSEKKNDNDYRIFCLGDSTVRGALFPEASFVKFLEVILRDILPESKIEVINAGVGGFDSSRSLELLLEISNYSPDLIIVYSSNNEFYHKYIPPGDSLIVKLNRLLNKSRFYFFIKRSIILAKNELISNNFNFAEKFHSVDVKYRRNLKEMIRQARNKKVKTLLCTIPVNLKDHLPLEARFSEELKDEDRMHYTRLLEKGVEFYRDSDYLAALDCFKKCLLIDKENAMGYYYIASSYENLGQYDKAKLNYQKACDLDGNKQRISSHLNQVIRSVSEEFSIPLADLIVAFEKESSHGLIGDNLFVDSVHPLPAGNWIIAKEICNVLYNEELIKPKKEWKWSNLRTEDEYENLLEIHYDNNRAFAFMYFYTGICYSNENWNCPERAVFSFIKAIDIYADIVEEELNYHRKFQNRKWWENNPTVFLNIGKAFFRNEDFHLALRYVNKAIDINAELNEANRLRKILLSKIRSKYSLNNLAF